MALKDKGGKDSNILKSGFIASNNLDILKSLTSSLLERENNFKDKNIELIKNNEFLKNILDSIPCLVFVKNRESRFIYVNNKVTELYGKRKEEIEGFLDTDFGIADECFKIHYNDIDVIEGKSEKRIISEFITDRNGKKRFFTTTKKPLIEKDGSCDFLLGISTEITDLIELQENYKKNQERFELATLAAEAGVWDWVDVREDEEWWSDKYFEILGYNPQEFSPTHSFWITELVHPEDSETLKQKLNLCFLNNEIKWQVEYRMRIKTGEYRNFRTTGEILRSTTGIPVRMLGFTYDITDIVSQEERTKILNEKYYSIMNSVLEPIIITDNKGNITFANCLMCLLTEYGQEELINNNISILIPPDKRKLHIEKFKKYLSGVGRGDIMGKIGRKESILTKSGITKEITLNVTDLILRDERIFVATMHE